MSFLNAHNLWQNVWASFREKCGRNLQADREDEVRRALLGGAKSYGRHDYDLLARRTSEVMFAAGLMGSLTATTSVVPRDY